MSRLRKLYGGEGKQAGVQPDVLRIRGAEGEGRTTGAGGGIIRGLIRKREVEGIAVPFSRFSYFSKSDEKHLDLKKSK